MKQLELEPYNEGYLLDGIYQMQRHLMQGYLDMEALPDWRVFDLNSKENQKFVRGIATYITEELCEADQVLSHIIQNTQMDAMNVEAREELRKTYIEELVDALHFMVELNIFSGISSEDMNDILNKQFAMKGLELLEGLPLHAFLRYARTLNIEEQMISEARHGTGYVMIAGDDRLKPFWRLSESMMTDLKILTLETISNLFGAINLLKNKEWRKSSTMINMKYYQTQITNYWIWFMRIIDLLDFKPHELYDAFLEKHRINVQRIIDKY